MDEVVWKKNVVRTHDDNYHPWYDFENSSRLILFLFRVENSLFDIWKFLFSSLSSINIMKVSCQSTDWKVVFLFIYITIKYININYAFLSALLASQSAKRTQIKWKSYFFCLIFFSVQEISFKMEQRKWAWWRRFEDSLSLSRAQ